MQGSSKYLHYISYATTFKTMAKFATSTGTVSSMKSPRTHKHTQARAQTTTNYSNHINAHLFGTLNQLLDSSIFYNELKFRTQIIKRL